ncbi:MAG TPA: carboxymuconolactone decarboxylase family protein [Candidatus Dormibacteraeota bacterium]|jgi:4-carboxymuconolactone decarboxylase|nr:carboxymuconolactone decarboxylase family protein [Candidatus Dormibacteraeota bacterium]
MPRVPDLALDALDPEQRRVHDAIAAGPRGGVHGPLRVWLHSPGLADRAQELGAFCRFHTSLPRRLSELAILVTAAAWRAGFEWHAHAPLAVEAGLDPEAVEAIRLGRTPALVREDEAAVYAFARELTETRTISEATYRRTAAVLDDRALVELVGILGYYTLISMTINAFQVPLPAGAPEPFPGP